jgi:hypothetical protein
MAKKHYLISDRSKISQSAEGSEKLKITLTPHSFTPDE